MLHQRVEFVDQFDKDCTRIEDAMSTAEIDANELLSNWSRISCQDVAKMAALHKNVVSMRSTKSRKETLQK